jgi:DNA-binding MarR family transcriptional regulator
MLTICQYPVMVRSTAGKALTDLILEIFRVNGALLRVGDRLTHADAQTSSRWQVLGAIADSAKPVSGIAREMGLTRQSVQRTTDLLERDGLVAFSDNPAHSRAKLVGLTPEGERVLEAITLRQVDWANHLARAIGEREILDALEGVRRLRHQLSHADRSEAAPSRTASRRRETR